MKLDIHDYRPVADWVHYVGLRLVLIFLVAMVSWRALAAVVTWLRNALHIRDQYENGMEESGTKQKYVLLQVMHYVLNALIVVVSSIKASSAMDLDLAAFAVPTTIAAAAVGFALQNVVKDYFMGVVLTFEKQYGYGDEVEFSEVGGESKITGLVESVTLRVTKIRTDDGALVTVPHGSIAQIVNRSREWSRAIAEITVPTGVAVADAEAAIYRAIGKLSHPSSSVSQWLLGESKVRGVRDIKSQEVSFEVSVDTKPARQDTVRLALVQQVAKELQSMGVVS